MTWWLTEPSRRPWKPPTRVIRRPRGRRPSAARTRTLTTAAASERPSRTVSDSPLVSARANAWVDRASGRPRRTARTRWRREGTASEGTPPGVHDLDAGRARGRPPRAPSRAALRRSPTRRRRPRSASRPRWIGGRLVSARTIATGMVAWCRHSWLTEPSMSSRNEPSPRAPRTRRLASSEALEQDRWARVVDRAATRSLPHPRRAPARRSYSTTASGVRTVYKPGRTVGAGVPWCCSR